MKCWHCETKIVSIEIYSDSGLCDKCFEYLSEPDEHDFDIEEELGFTVEKEDY